MGDHRPHITALSAHARDQEGHVPGESTNLREFPRIGGADHQRAIAAAVPAAGRQLREPLRKACGRRSQDPAGPLPPGFEVRHSTITPRSS